MNTVGAKGQCTASTSSTLLDDVAGFRDFLVGLKQDPKQVIVGAIMGTPEPVAVELRAINGSSEVALAHSCSFQSSTGSAVADPGVRIKSLLDLFPQSSVTSTICQQDLSGALGALGALVAKTSGSPCIAVPLVDIDPGSPGIQVDCVVEDAVGTGVIAIAPCDASETPTCWKVEADPATCSSAQNLKLVVVRSAPLDPSTITRMRCRVQ
jgi:hypothetical protein